MMTQSMNLPLMPVSLAPSPNEELMEAVFVLPEIILHLFSYYVVNK